MTGRSVRKPWKGGLFDYNPQDPEVSIPRPNGLGYTLNFAHREAWVVIGVILSIPLMIVFLVAVVAGLGPK